MPAAAILNRSSLDAYRYREMVQSGQGLRLHRRGAALNMIVKQLLNVSVECAHCSAYPRADFPDRRLATGRN